MSDASEAREIAAWLRRFRWALGGLPEAERAEIAAEARAHIDERVAAGASAREALAAFGDPQTYAESFVEEMELARALSGERFPSLLGAVARRVHRSLVAGLAFLAVLILGTVALGMAAAAVAKLFDPVHAGLWLGPGELFFGIATETRGRRELLGPWIHPLAILVAVATWALARWVLIRAVRALDRGR